MIKILDLFSGTQSVLKAIKLEASCDFIEYEKRGNVVIATGYWDRSYDFKPMYEPAFEYIGLDIYDEEKNTIFDLAQDNVVENLLKLLPKDWIPDFIWASPLCTVFSVATSIKNGTLALELINNELVPRQDFSYITHKKYIHLINNSDFINKYQEQGRIGLKLFENTKKIVGYFNVPFAIENPASAYSRLIMKEFIRNETAYCMYGFDYKKPTAIYSNTELNLLKCTHKKHKTQMSGSPKKTGIKPTSSNNRDRSRVPPSLIADILRKRRI